MKSLIGLTKSELAQELVGVEAYRAKQIWSWIYYYGKTNFDDMNNISKDLRKELGEKYTLERARIVKHLVSRDGTQKWLLEFCSARDSPFPSCNKHHCSPLEGEQANEVSRGGSNTTSDNTSQKQTQNENSLDFELRSSSSLPPTEPQAVLPPPQGGRNTAACAEQGERAEQSATIEMVYIPETDRGTLCISSQIGCAMNCKFCNTGKQGFTRNLTTEEIVQQVLIARDELGEWNNLNKGIGQGRAVSNIVFMGMGEPLLNYENVAKAIKIINDPDGIAFSNRRITLSTCGIVSQIKKMGGDLKVNLALSLHAPNDEIRKKIMPIATQYNIDETLRACGEYAAKNSDRRVTFEYILIDGLNDSEKNAYELINLIKKHKIPAKFNLIPFNEWNGCDFKTSKNTRQFATILADARFPAPVRKARGQDIMAACGQLKGTIM